MKYALVREWLTSNATGGSELVVQEILKHIDADLYALIDFESTNRESYVYIRNFWLDIWIILKIVGVVIAPKNNGAY
ncbi:hypothetical protein Cri9333_0119 [Crinalium epipsammum PCC 9333]|uniref:Uncharacterized protein n=1 Tax=Crinalium epipsammum PCC 9333 TaxID=1173022 RepID=K9VU86_9CYAN|nr:hypothetical protein Cri9333_0119 [Crinalium epipsammum PCC 9333]